MLSYVSALLFCAKLMTFRYSKRDRIDGVVLSGVTTSIDIIYLFYSKVTSLLSVYSSLLSTRQPYPGQGTNRHNNIKYKVRQLGKVLGKIVGSPVQIEAGSDTKVLYVTRSTLFIGIIIDYSF